MHQMEGGEGDFRSSGRRNQLTGSRALSKVLLQSASRVLILK